jgi:methanogenic corrinoid protein MtbC1
MLATPTGEQHVLALRMVADLLREVGCQVVMLGPDVPSDALAAAARAHAPHAVVLSSTIPGGADQLMIAIYEVQREFPTTGFVIGGRAVTSRLRSLPGIGVCERVSDAVEAVDAIVHHAEHN